MKKTTALIQLTIMLFVPGILINSKAAKKTAQTPKVYNYIKARDGLVLRSGPGVKFDKKLTIPYGTKVPVLEYTKKAVTINKIKAKWAKVTYLNNTGWVFAGYLSPKPTRKTESYYISRKTIIIYYPKLTQKDFADNEGLNETAADYNYYTSLFLTKVKKYRVKVIKCEGKSQITVFNKKKDQEIEIPSDQHAFGYIFINPKLEYQAYPGIYTELIDEFKKFFEINTK